MYLDISLFLRVGSTQRQIDSTGQRKLTVNIEVPSRFWAPFGVRRTFFVVRTHNNNAETIAKSAENIVPVDTGLFSTYALAYVDEPVNAVRFDSGLKISQKNDKIKVSWDKAEGVAKYEVYATYCGKKFPKKPTKTTKSTSVTIKKIKDKKIDFTKNFKLYVKAYDSNGNVVGNSVHAHFAGKDHEKYKNPKDIKLGAKNGFAKKVAVTVN